MNIDDINDVDFPVDDMLEAIFEKQKGLMDRYHSIEERQKVGYGILRGNIFNINEIRSQCLVKDFAWRTTEELTEATECEHTDQAHFFEELSDALHFYTELCIMIGITPTNIMVQAIPLMTRKPLMDILESMNLVFPQTKNPYDIVVHLGLAMNCLKQKPWKQTHVLTDTKKFEFHIIRGYICLLTYMISSKMTPEEIFMIYFKKNLVNQFRQKSNY